MFVPVAIALLFFLCAGTEGANVTQAQFYEIDDRIIACVIKLPEPYGPWGVCRFRGLDALGNEKTQKEDLTKVVGDCLVEAKAYKKKDISKTKSCLKKSLAKPLTSKK